MLLVEQSIAVCRAVADRPAVLDEGRIVWTGRTPTSTRQAPLFRDT
jgi:branched-chain amino acid transport system ATP-binding protein